MKMIMKIVAVPVLMILTVLNWLINGAARVYVIVLALFYQILAVCGLMALVKHQWTSLGILVVMFSLSLGIVFGAGTIMAIVDDMKDNLKGVIRS